jgi:hypothetical protein
MTGVILLLLFTNTAATLVACGGGSGESSADADGGAGGVGAAADEANDAGAGGVAEPWPADGGAGGAGGLPASDLEECHPTNEVDAPDADFTDANCDGIDGDAKHAIFVSPDGFDSDDGSIEAPVQSLTQAISLAKGDGLAVYVCNGTYRENIVIDAPVSIYGGYDCTRAWKRTKDIAILEAGAGVPLIVKDVEGKIHLERLAFRATTAAGASQSSQAAAIVRSSDVSLDQVELKAGSGTRGTAGTDGIDVSSSPPPDSARGASTKTSDCFAPDPGGSPGAYCDSYAGGGFSATAVQRCAAGFPTRGGSGGAGGNIWLANGMFTCQRRGLDEGDDGLYGQYQDSNGSWKEIAAANSGANGADGTDGWAAAFGIGSVEDGIYAATNAGSDGAPGQPGWPGKGGAGGDSTGHMGDVCGSDYHVGSGGGQGGLGGCGGGQASGGGAGGGAVALVIVDSTVKISNARLSVGDGGNGGDGAQGGTPQPGAAGAPAGSAKMVTYVGAQGQAGGMGGMGGDGGPGGGGPSIAILYTGAMPEVTEAVYEIGSPGDGGQAFSGPNGPTGATGEVMSLDEILGK